MLKLPITSETQVTFLHL